MIFSQLLYKFHTLYGNRKFITVFTNARHLSLTKLDQSTSRLTILFLATIF